MDTAIRKCYEATDITIEALESIAHVSSSVRLADVNRAELLNKLLKIDAIANQALRKLEKMK